jgi:DNA-binding transcriptional ArsR family regulator
MAEAFRLNGFGQPQRSKRVITDESIAPVAALLADPTRMAILWALADGRPRPAGELARQARVSASTASEHLARLVAGGLIGVERHGRHRYYRVGEAKVIAAIEAIGALARPASSRGSPQAAAVGTIRHARSCYDHLAGALSVQVTHALIDRGVLVLRDEQYEIPPAGAVFLSNELGVDVDQARASRRQFAKACLDWTEREYHVAGAVGSEMLRQFISLGWLERMQGNRGLCVTASGLRGFRRILGIDALASRYAYGTGLK